MNDVCLYEVGARRRYRGHEPGTRFLARLNPNAAQRAIQRGDITLIQRVTPSVRPGSYRLPQGWLNSKEEVQ